MSKTEPIPANVPLDQTGLPATSTEYCWSIDEEIFKGHGLVSTIEALHDAFNDEAEAEDIGRYVYIGKAVPIQWDKLADNLGSMVEDHIADRLFDVLGEYTIEHWSPDKADISALDKRLQTAVLEWLKHDHKPPSIYEVQYIGKWVREEHAKPFLVTRAGRAQWEACEGENWLWLPWGPQ